MVRADSTELPHAEGQERANAFVQFLSYVLGRGHERNLGGMERLIRYAFGVLFVLAGVGIVIVPVLANTFANAFLALVLVVLGANSIYQAQVQYCPLNNTIGWSSYSEK